MKNNIGEARRSYELVHGRFTQQDAAAYFGVGGSTYKGWEQGRGKLNGEILCAIADKYGCSVDYLLCRTDIPDFEEERNPGLLARERELVELFRSTDERGKDAIMTIAESQAGDDRAVQSDRRRSA